MTTENLAVSNDAIADLLEETVLLMGLVEENPFKVKAIEKAASAIRSMDAAATELVATNALHAVSGVGKSIAAYVEEIIQTGTFTVHQQLLNLIPAGVIEMQGISGIGPKKLQTLWKTLQITSLDELENACRTGVIAKTKGFGAKTEQQILTAIVQIREQRGWLLLHHAHKAFHAIAAICKEIIPNCEIHATGELLRSCPIVKRLAIVIATDDNLPAVQTLQQHFAAGNEPALFANEQFFSALFKETAVDFHICQSEKAPLVIFQHSWPEESPVAQQLLNHFPDSAATNPFLHLGIPYRASALRESDESWFITPPDWSAAWNEDRLLQRNQLQGLLHLHTTYSDGMHTLAEMAQAAIGKGFGYMLVTDHSRAAVYANGLSIERLQRQFEAIEALNQQLSPFVILKGIESDILSDGSLDYPDEVLAQFDAVIASIHSGFKMDEAQATSRLIRAIENQYTTILGHSTGRLLLKRQGYPINHLAIIDACAANNVAIELNCNPYRMDIDWRWIPYALSKRVKIAITPDAHSIDEIDYCQLGVSVAQKGGLTAAQTLNCLSVSEFKAFKTRV
jgi:DNA polymerase (family X)